MSQERPISCVSQYPSDNRPSPSLVGAVETQSVPQMRTKEHYRRDATTDQSYSLWVSCAVLLRYISNSVYKKRQAGLEPQSQMLQQLRILATE